MRSLARASFLLSPSSFLSLFLSVCSVMATAQQQYEEDQQQLYQSSFIVTEHVIPPANFAMVCPGVYRAGYPKPMNHTFLKCLKLKTLIFLCPEDCDEANGKFCRQNGVQILQFGIQGNKEPFSDIPEPVCFLFFLFLFLCSEC